MTDEHDIKDMGAENRQPLRGDEHPSPDADAAIKHSADEGTGGFGEISSGEPLSQVEDMAPKNAWDTEPLNEKDPWAYLEKPLRAADTEDFGQRNNPYGQGTDDFPPMRRESGSSVAEPQSQPVSEVPQPQGVAYHTGPAYTPYGYNGPAYPAAGTPGVVPEKKKMSRGLKVFLWILSVLSVGTIAGFSVFLVYEGMNAPSSSQNLYENLPGKDYGEDPFSSVPDEGQQPPEVDDDVIPEPDVTQPDVSVEPNHEGISITEKPTTAELSAEAVYNKVAASTVTVGATLVTTEGEGTSTGTGIIATADGYIITNSHVVLDSKNTTVKVTTFDEKEYDAVVVGVDRTTDLAILKMNDHNFTPAEFGDADELGIGEWVLAIGNPGGARFSSSLTRGIISGLNRTVGSYSENGMTYIQTDAAINPGNSGGPLVNMHGQVVGINSSKIITTGYEGMGFAIPVSKAQEIINELLSGGYVKGRTRLGIRGTDVQEMDIVMYSLPQGFKIASVDEESAFSGTGVEMNDIITAIEGEPVTGITDISNYLLRFEPGDQVAVTIYRMSSDETFDVTITLLEDKGETQQ